MVLQRLAVTRHSNLQSLAPQGQLCCWMVVWIHTVWRCSHVPCALSFARAWHTIDTLGGGHGEGYTLPPFKERVAAAMSNCHSGSADMNDALLLQLVLTNLSVRWCVLCQGRLPVQPERTCQVGSLVVCSMVALQCWALRPLCDLSRLCDHGPLCDPALVSGWSFFLGHCIKVASCQHDSEMSCGLKNTAWVTKAHSHMLYVRLLMF